VVAVYANCGKSTVSFTSLAHDQNLGRPYNCYIVGVPDLLVIADPVDVDQLEAYLLLGAPHVRYPLHILESLRQLDYDREFALLILQGMTGVDRQAATTLLQGAGGATKTGIAMSLLHVTAEVARQPLSAHNGRLRETLTALDRQEHRSRNQVIFFHHAQHKPPTSLTFPTGTLR